MWKKRKEKQAARQGVAGKEIIINPNPLSAKAYQRNQARAERCKEMLRKLESQGKKDTVEYQLFEAELLRRHAAIKEYFLKGGK